MEGSDDEKECDRVGELVEQSSDDDRVDGTL